LVKTYTAGRVILYATCYPVHAFENLLWQEHENGPHMRKGKRIMDTPSNTQTGSNSQRSSIGSAVREVFRESRKQRLMIRNSSGNKVFDCSLLLALILSVGAPVLPAFVILGVWVEALSVSIENV
jgi:hypothetical protein